MWTLLIASLCIVQVFGATTMMPSTKHHGHHHGHHTHPTRESVEAEKHYFRYDPMSHRMMAINAKACYVYQMSTQEAVDVHTTHGLHLLEIKLITMIDDDTAVFQSMTHDQLMAVSKTFAHVCKATNMIMGLN